MSSAGGAIVISPARSAAQCRELRRKKASPVGTVDLRSEFSNFQFQISNLRFLLLLLRGLLRTFSRRMLRRHRR
jgi:hypothetical protein